MRTIIAATAHDSGRSRGHLGLFATTAMLPPVSAIDHPYIAGTDDADTLSLHLGQTVTLTIFMHPSGKASLTSGILPRKALALARDWVGPGLAAIAPSLRTGPVLVETDLGVGLGEIGRDGVRTLHYTRTNKRPPTWAGCSWRRRSPSSD